MNNLLKEPVEIRLSRAKNKKTDPATLDVLSHDSFWFVRNFVATNPSTSFDTLHYLLQDDDFRVRFEAKKNLENRDLNNIIKSAEQKSNHEKTITNELVR